MVVDSVIVPVLALVLGSESRLAADADADKEESRSRFSADGEVEERFFLAVLAVAGEERGVEEAEVVEAVESVDLLGDGVLALEFDLFNLLLDLL